MDKSILPQNMPIVGEEEVLSKVIEDLKDRAIMGEKKYGTLLKTFNGRDSMTDAYQEALDLVMYIKQTLMEKNFFMDNLPKNKFKIAFDLDDVILNTTPEILNNLHYYGFPTDPFDEIQTYDLLHHTSADKKQLNQAIDDSLWQYLPFINSFTPEIFLYLHQKDVEIYIVSHRKEEFRSHIIANLEKLDIAKGEYTLVLIPNCTLGTCIPDKASFCIENKIDIIVDDRLDTLGDINSRTETKSVVFDRPWNKQASLYRIYYLDQIFDLLPKGNE